MEIEYIAGICLATRRALENQRNLTVGHRLLGKVVVHDECVAAGIAEILADGYTGKRREVTHGGRLGSSGGNHNRIVKRSVLAQCLHYGGHRRCFLADGDIDTEHRLAGLIVLALVYDCVDGDGGFANLAVADDELALTAAYGHHRVDSLDTGLKRLLHRLAIYNTRGLTFQRKADKVTGNGTTTIDRFTKNVYYASEQTFAHWNGGNLAGAAHSHVFCNFLHLIEQNHADIALLEVQCHTAYSVFKLYEFISADLVEAIDVSHAIAYFENGAYFLELYFGINLFKFLFEYLGNLAGIYHS